MVNDYYRIADLKYIAAGAAILASGGGGAISTPSISSQCSADTMQDSQGGRFFCRAVAQHTSGMLALSHILKS